MQRAIRDNLTDKALSAQGKAERLFDTADQLGLTRQPAPDPQPPIADDDIHLICWTAILPAPGAAERASTRPHPADDISCSLRPTVAETFGWLLRSPVAGPGR